MIAGYNPKTSKSEDLRQLMQEHFPILKSQGLVTGREPIMIRAKDSTIIGVFEWKSQAAIDKVHANAAVLEMWGKYSNTCNYIPIGQIPEAAQLFSAFIPFSQVKIC